MSDGLSNYMGDLATCWWVFIVMAFISLAISIIYLILLRCFAKPIMYLSFVLILVLLAGGGAYVFAQQHNYEEGDNTRSVMKWMGIVLWILTGIYFVILMCCCGRIRLGIAILEATSDFVRDTMSIFFVPTIFFFFICVWMCYWIISAVYVYSVGEPKGLGQIEWNDTTRYVWLYHLFGLFWISAFIIGCEQFVIAACACIWYYEQGAESDQKGKATLRTGFRWIFKYHMGSIAFGSLIIAIMEMIKTMFEYFRKKAENAGAN